MLIDTCHPRLRARYLGNKSDSRRHKHIRVRTLGNEARSTLVSHAHRSNSIQSINKETAA
jgi:hypothetical protein